MKFLIFVLVSIFIKEIQSGGGPSPSPKTLPSVCHGGKSKELFDTSGNYIKTACLALSSQITYANGENLCRNNGMDLFKLSDARTYDSLYKLAKSNPSSWNNPSYLYLWVNGRRSPNGTFLTQPGDGPLYSGINWIRDQSKDCLLLYITFEGDNLFGASKYNCGENAFTLCEFYKF